MGKGILFTALLTLVVSAGAFAQEEEIPHSDVHFGIGAAVPTGADTSYLGKAPIISLGYEYQLNRYFAAGGAFEMAFGAANNQNLETSEYGSYIGGDHEFMIPFVARFIAPLPFEKWQVSAGAGPAYLHYAETAPSGTYYCFTCTARGGWGFHGTGDVKHFLGDSNTFYIGGKAQYIMATLNGLPVGNSPGTKTKDRWWNALVTLGLRF